ncbi:MAG TPA: beta-galactosidase [Tepidisphaeraceae bacterium]
MGEARHRKNAAEWVMWIAIAPLVLVARIFSRFQRVLIFAALMSSFALAKEDPAAAIETVHREHVPHTDKHGHVLLKYDPKQSFFMIGSWGHVLPNGAGGPYPDFKEMTDAGFNTIWPLNWDDAAIPLAEQADIQLVYMGAMDAARQKKLKSHPNLLGNMWTDEPTGKLNIPDFDMDEYFGTFTTYKKQVNESMPGLPVFINDPPAIFPDPPKFKQWWLKWNTAGDISCQDNYPLVDRQHRTRSLAQDPTGIPQMVSLAVSSNGGKKPVWTIVGAFSSPNDAQWAFRMPTPMQLRAQVYTAVTSGATGIAYFILDSHESRRAGCIGFNPQPKAQYASGEAAIATPADLVQSKALWEMTRQINTELRALSPSILSPTAGADVPYKVAVKGESTVTKTPLRCLLKHDPAGGYELLTVNTDDAALDVTFDFPNALKTVEPRFDNRPHRTLDTARKKWADRYEPFDVHVYRLTLP